jgi:DNA-binding transcriptional LysR family regulator
MYPSLVPVWVEVHLTFLMNTVYPRYMIGQMDLRRVHTLRMVDQQGTVTAAAEHLHLTPSAVSHQISQLARELGLQLLERRGRRVYLTPAGQALVAHADELSARWERARAELLHDPAGDGIGSVRLAAFPSAVAGLLVPAVKEMGRTCPNLSTSIVETEGPHGYDLLLMGEADIFVTEAGGEARPGNARFDEEPLLDEPLDLLVPGSHELARSPGARVADLSGEDWIVPFAGSCDFYDLTLAACTIAGFAPRIAHQARDSIAVNAMVAAGLGIALIPRLAASAPRGDTVRLPITGHPRPSRRVLACTRAGSDGQPAIRAASASLRSVAAAV